MKLFPKGGVNLGWNKASGFPFPNPKIEFNVINKQYNLVCTTQEEFFLLLFSWAVYLYYKVFRGGLSLYVLLKCTALWFLILAEAKCCQKTSMLFAWIVMLLFLTSACPMESHGPVYSCIRAGMPRGSCYPSTAALTPALVHLLISSHVISWCFI